jgi:hypothetical protein
MDEEELDDDDLYGSPKPTHDGHAISRPQTLEDNITTPEFASSAEPRTPSEGQKAPSPIPNQISNEVEESTNDGAETDQEVDFVFVRSSSQTSN